MIYFVLLCTVLPQQQVYHKVSFFTMCTNASARVQAGLTVGYTSLSVSPTNSFFSITANDCDVIVEAEVEVNNGDHVGRRNQPHPIMTTVHCRPLTPS